MMMDMEVMHSGQQDMDLIDILWKQDIDLGARREVFDYNHRQKEYELQRQRELEEEKKLHLLREQEKALLAQLQLDEETGEYIPRPPPSAPLQPTGTPLEVTQNVGFTEETGDSMSFDECLQLLAETFPVEGTENASVCMDTPATSSNIMMSPEQPALSPANLPSAQLALPQRMTPDLEQAWMELWSLPELQQCLNMPMKDTMETTSYPLSNNSEVQSPGYTNYLQMQTPIFNPMTTVSDVKTNSLNVPTEFMNTFDGSVPSLAPSHNFRDVKLEAPQLNSSFSADMFYLNTELEESSGQPSSDVSESTSDVSNKPTYTTMDLYSLSPGESFDKSKQNLTEEHPDSDSGISIQGSPNSPSKSAYGGESFRYDSEMEDMDHSPGSTESDYSEIFPINYQLDNPESEVPASALTGEPEQEKKPKQHTVDPAEKSGHSGAPFTKDKPKRRSDVRLSRDEQKAKTLKIPFTVNMIINLPVDDFNELMSKHQLNEAQLALVRDIRRRGKNKVAAQNCRKRKMENIVGLEGELDSLKEEKERLLKEKSKTITDLKEMKQQLTSLYQEVFSQLRDEKGNSYSPLDYSLQQSTDGSIFLVPRTKKTLRSEDNHLSPL